MPENVAVVIAGAGARGGYEIGVLSVLIPRLHEMGVSISTYIGTSAGALNAAILAAYAHLPPDQQVQQAIDVLRGFRMSDVFVSPVITSPGIALRFVGRALGVPGVRLTSLLDTQPLRRKAESAINWAQLRSNLDEYALTLAVVATSCDSGRTTVFVDRSADARPLPPSDDGRAIDYISTRISQDHLLASAAIPIAFPPVRINGHGWFLDGSVRLNAPLKPAISLGAEALVAVATQPLDEPSPPPQPTSPPSDVDTTLVQLLDIVLVDRMIEDARTLCKVNNLVGPQSNATRVHHYRKVPLLFVGPASRSTLGDKAIEVYDSQLPSGRGVLEMFRRYELRLLERAFLGGGARRGDLLSYLYFDRHFIEESIALGQRDAERHFEQALDDEVPWTSR